MDKRDFRALFLFEWKLGLNAPSAAREINGAFGESTVNEGTVRYWYKKFEKGNECLDDEIREGRPVVVDREKIRALVEEDPYISIRTVAEEIGASPSSVYRHLRSMGKVKRSDVWVDESELIED